MHEAWVLFASHVHWMGWNLILAFVPLAIGASLFRTTNRRTVGWWLGLALFVAFLPNAPYVMSDLVHLPADVRAASSMKVVLLGLLPLYACYILAGLQAYVLSLGLLRRYMRATGSRRFLVAVDVGAAFCTAVGVFLGRVDRVNSMGSSASSGKDVVGLALAAQALATHLGHGLGDSDCSNGGLDCRSVRCSSRQVAGNSAVCKPVVRPSYQARRRRGGLLVARPRFTRLNLSQ